MAQSHVGRVYCDAVAELLEYAGDADAGALRQHGSTAGWVSGCGPTSCSN